MTKEIANMVGWFAWSSTMCLQHLMALSYGNTGCGVFKRGEKLERFLPKNQHTQRKLLNFENWVNGEVSKCAKI